MCKNERKTHTLRHKKNGENAILQAEEIKRNAILRLLGNSETMPYFRPKKNAML